MESDSQYSWSTDGYRTGIADPFFVVGVVKNGTVIRYYYILACIIFSVFAASPPVVDVRNIR